MGIFDWNKQKELQLSDIRADLIAMENEIVEAALLRVLDSKEDVKVTHDQSILLLEHRDLKKNAIDITARIEHVYRQVVLPQLRIFNTDLPLTKQDRVLLSLLIKRIHYGKFVAEAKFRSQSTEYTKLITQQNTAAIMELLTNSLVEEQVVKRVAMKAAAATESSTPRITAWLPRACAMIYFQAVIPVTKEVEVEYLLKRTGTQAVSLPGLHDDGALVNEAISLAEHKAELEHKEDTSEVTQYLQRRRSKSNVSKTAAALPKKKRKQLLLGHMKAKADADHLKAILRRAMH